MNRATLSPISESNQNWWAVLGMSLGAFALVSSEFMPVSLLTPIAGDLHSTEGQAGLAISFSGAFALLTSLFISTIARSMDRKVLLLFLTFTVIVSGTIVALASNYGVFMIGRALIGIAIGGFWSMSAATAMRLVSEEHIPRALAIVNGGNALATVIAAPLGSYLGGIIGWRGAFFTVVPVAALTFLWLFISLPSMKAASANATKNVLTLLKSNKVALGMAAVSVFFMGQFTLFTYLRPFLESATGASVSTLSLILLVMGVAGFIGTVIIGSFLKNHLYRTLIFIPLLMSVIAIGLMLLGSGLYMTITLLGIWGLLGTAAPAAWWTWLAKTLPDDAEAGGGLFVAIVQLAITGGATLGGILFDLSGYMATFSLSAFLLLSASFLAYLTAKLSQS